MCFCSSQIFHIFQNRLEPGAVTADSSVFSLVSRRNDNFQDGTKFQFQVYISNLKRLLHSNNTSFMANSPGSHYFGGRGVGSVRVEARCGGRAEARSVTVGRTYGNDSLIAEERRGE